MNTGYDAYSLLARILPGYITLTPLLLLFILLPHGAQLSFAGAAFLFPVIYFISDQIGRVLGKGKEKALWTKWGGPPTTRFLRHSNEDFNKTLRAMVHEKLRNHKAYVPSAEDEEADSEGADNAYALCTRLLIAYTRQVDRFPLVFRALATYGLYRNLLGLRPVGIVFTFLSLGVCGVYLFSHWPETEAVIAGSVVTLVNAALLFVWASRVTESVVKGSAEEYARFLLEAALVLEDK